MSSIRSNTEKIANNKKPVFQQSTPKALKKISRWSRRLSKPWGILPYWCVTCRALLLALLTTNGQDPSALDTIRASFLRVFQRSVLRMFIHVKRLTPPVVKWLTSRELGWGITVVVIQVGIRLTKKLSTSAEICVYKQQLPSSHKGAPARTMRPLVSLIPPSHLWNEIPKIHALWVLHAKDNCY